MPAGLHDVGEHSRCGGFAIGAGNCGDRNATRRTRRIKHIEYFTGDITRLTLTRRHMHAKARASIDFDNGTPDVFVRMRNIIGKKIYPTNIETDRAHGANRHFTIIRVHYIS